MRGQRLRRSALVAAAIAAATLAGFGSTRGAQAPASLSMTQPLATGDAVQQADPDLLTAIAEYIQLHDHSSYAGDCQTLHYPDDLHKECSTITLVADGVARVGIGEAFTDGGNWVVFVRLPGGRWLDVAEVPGCIGYDIPADGIATVSVQVNGQWVSAATVLPCLR